MYNILKTFLSERKTIQLLALFVFLSVAHGQQIEGTVEGKGFSINGSVVRTNLYRFRVRLDQCSWEIKLIPIVSLYNPPEEYTEVSYDGINLRSVMSMKAMMEKLRAGNRARATLMNKGGIPPIGESPHNGSHAELIPVSAREHDATGSISYEEVPLVANTLVSPVFITFASECFFREYGNGMAPALFLQGLDGDYLALPFDRKIKQKLSVKRTQTPAMIPDELVTFCDGTKTTGFSTWETYPKPFDDGFTNATFSVVKRFGKKWNKLPQESVFSVYYPNPQTKTLQKLQTYHVRATKISEVTSPVGMIPLPPRTLLSDRRPKGEEVHGRQYHDLKVWP